MEPGLYSNGMHKVLIYIPPHLLNAGRYYLSVDGLIPSVGYVFRYEHAVEFELFPYGGAGGIKNMEHQGI